VAKINGAPGRALATRRDTASANEIALRHRVALRLAISAAKRFLVLLDGGVARLGRRRGARADAVAGFARGYLGLTRRLTKLDGTSLGSSATQ